MSTRNERRQEKKKLKKKFANPLVRRILKSELERGKGTEIYRLDDDGTGRSMFFNISLMREWAEQNCEIFNIPIDHNIASRLIESGAVDAEHIVNHTIRTEIKPIIVCQEILGGDRIVDGAHRFVAMCIASADLNIQSSVPGYVLKPREWKRFIVPLNVANALSFK